MQASLNNYADFTFVEHVCESEQLMQVKQNERRVLEQMGLEEERFLKTIAAGEGELEKVMAKAKASNTPLPGSAAFLLYDAHGFPLELTKEVAESRGLTVDEEGFRQEMQEQKQRSKVRSAPRCALVAQP